MEQKVETITRMTAFREDIQQNLRTVLVDESYSEHRKLTMAFIILFMLLGMLLSS